ncbi:hypothetical protein RHGRI_007613 [Rhododendron griersonianum]|uniref:Uncharacterized protein n=1 Tax=Rhododendron griersonianum TaxID=479676 RepID=A0AAV6KXG4_9ERIC|nr:hypothetical protein RHGRI_007613 [Rhododendron griersonianum]
MEEREEMRWLWWCVGGGGSGFGVAVERRVCEVSLVVKVTEGYQFEDLIGSISNKWNGLVSMRLLYSVCDHLNILLENDDDFRNMMDLAAAYALQKNGIDVSNYIDPLYTADAFRFSYDCPIHPVPISTLGVAQVSENSAVILPLILPPKTRRPRGRPKVARIRSRGEKLRQIRCGRCKKLGNHNRKICKEACD